MNGLAQSPGLILTIIAAYFSVLLIVAHWTTKDGANNESFFTANRNSPWFLVAIGMIGASLSGVTFISIPGLVGKSGANMGFSYMQMVFGYLVGYFVIATVLMPIYYKYNLTTIYGYLEKRLGFYAYKTGSAFFLLSRLIGAAFRLYLVAIVLDRFVLGPLGIPFSFTVLITIILIWIYTSKGGIKTIVVTDVFQTFMMLSAVVLTIVGISFAMDKSFLQLFELVDNANYSQIWHFKGGWSDPNTFFKQFTSGALIALVMTGLDQDMMQKNLTCRTLGDAQKNIFTFSFILIFANLLFLTLGALLYVYADHIDLQIPARSDYLYPTIALEYLSPTVGLAFVLGLIAAAYSSADSALTALTTAFCVDFLGFEKKEKVDVNQLKTRRIVHVGMSLTIFIIIMLFHAINNDAVINGLFKIAGYTYGPILGLFAFSILTRRRVRDGFIPAIAMGSILITYLLDTYSRDWFDGLELGFMNLALNGLLSFIGLYLISYSESK